MRELAQSINHHLRTPLAAILGHTDLLLDHRQHLPAQAQDSLAGILRAGSRLDDVVTSICDLVEVACGCPGDEEAVDVPRLVASVVADCRGPAEARGVRVVLTGTGAAVCTADPGRVGRAIRALLDDAVTHAPSGSVVRVATVPTPGRVRITVRCEVSVASADREPGEERWGCEATREAATSTGLGLTLASAVASAHGGRLVLTDSPGGGREARLDLPTGVVAGPEAQA